MTNALQKVVDDMFVPTSPSDTDNEEDIGFVMLDGDRIDPHVVRRLAAKLHEMAATAIEANGPCPGDDRFKPLGPTGMPSIGQLIELSRLFGLLDDDDPTERITGAQSVLHWVLGRGRSHPFDQMAAQATAAEEALV